MASLIPLLYKRFDRPDLVLQFGARECILQATRSIAEDIEKIDGVTGVWEVVDTSFEHGMNVVVAILHITYSSWTPTIEQLNRELLADGFVYRPEFKSYECRLIFDELGS
jgi:hypothetical protein